MKTIRKRLTWILLTLILLPMLVSGVWYWQQLRQQQLDRALIEAIKKDETVKAVALLDQGADANAVDMPDIPITMQSLLLDFSHRLKGNKAPKDSKFYPSALMLRYSLFMQQITPIHHGSITMDTTYSNFSNPVLFKALLEHGADPNVKDQDGTTPLMVADYECARLLIEHGADVNAKDKDGRTALMHYQDDLKFLQLLIDHHADINSQDRMGFTSLHIYAIRQGPGSAAVRRFLLQHGAKVSVKDKYGRIPLDYARLFGNGDAIPLLETALKKAHDTGRDH